MRHRVVSRQTLHNLKIINKANSLVNYGQTKKKKKIISHTLVSN